MRWLKQHYTGYVRVRLTGRSPERFFNLCRSSKILLWNIACEKEEYRFFLLLPDFYRIRPFARKAGVRVRIQEKLGLPFFLYRNRKRKLFAVGAASFFLLLFVLSRFIWNISFSGNLLFTDDMLTGQLREIGVCYGHDSGSSANPNIYGTSAFAFPDSTSETWAPRSSRQFS